MPLVFFHGPYEAGEFAGEAYPREAGVYSYLPIEGIGHEELNLARQAGAEPRCHFDTDGLRTTFTVRGCPRYGRIELADFVSGPIPQ